MKKSTAKTLIVFLIGCILLLTQAAMPAMAYADTLTEETTISSPGSPDANLPYLFAVYAITWIAFFAYVFYLSQKQRDLSRDIKELRRALAERERN